MSADLCKQVLSLDDKIRFSGIVDKTGKLVFSEQREGLSPLLTGQETQQSIAQSFMKMAMRKLVEKKLGKIIYAIAVYEKTVRASIAIDNYFSSKYSVLALSFDKEADCQRIILEKVLPFLKQESVQQ
jgi:hypothetical protein